MPLATALVALAAVAVTMRPCEGSWWLLAMPSAHQFTLHLSQDYKHQCQQLHYLVARQRELCALSKNMLAIVSQGAQMGLRECQNQFAGRRWNCSTLFEKNLPVVNGQLQDTTSKNSTDKLTKYRRLADSKTPMLADSPLEVEDVGDVFGGILKLHSREKAYVHAISAAGVAYSITRACSQGQMPSCSCDQNVERRKVKRKDQWEWGGCSEDIAYGERLSKDFVDSNELAKAWYDPAPKLMNLHNNEAGRRAIRSNMKLMCKCHGVSGSCTVKICWRRMDEFKMIGEKLYKKFDGATRVKFSGQRHKLKPAVAGHKKPTKRDLVYLEESPDFCQANSKYGIFGTKGRECKKNSYGTDGCAILCCGRGYTTVVLEKIQDCNCKFKWCCEVRCDKCKVRIETNYCK